MLSEEWATPSWMILPNWWRLTVEIAWISLLLRQWEHLKMVERSSAQNTSRLSSMTEQDQIMILSRETAYLASENLTPSPPQNREIKITVLQNNVALFAQLYIAMQSRDGDLKEFSSHEVQSFPPSLSEFGNLCLPSAKSELLKCLPQPSEQTDPPSQFDCRWSCHCALPSNHGCCHV